MLTALTSSLVFINRLCIQHHQIMVRAVSTTSNLKNAVTETISEVNGITDTYEGAIATLNSLQSNASTVAKSVAIRQHNGLCTQIPQMERFLKRSGLDNKLDGLSMIHVAGTKGKVRHHILCLPLNV